ncbi:hypothetical protein JQ543_05825 [Bradyrhizobium diazoefficiens]|nr:hypothetical protein [Bradyrhizobium diazoefficiens]MBR0847257.1 hypothetical protein [Bradyrhizobium diazoefficiens]
MTNDEAEDRRPALRLVSENADREIDIRHAKQQVTTKLSNLAAAVLRTIAGSATTVPVMRSAQDYLDAQKQLVALSGTPLSVEDEKRALCLVEARLSSHDSDFRYREYEHAAGIEKILRGALRTAAHQVLKEREHFGGKYSTLAIEDGIALVVGTSRDPEKPKPRKRKTIS